MPYLMINWIHYAINTVAVLVIIMISMPWFIILIFPIGAAFWYILDYYVRSSRELKELRPYQVRRPLSFVSWFLIFLVVSPVAAHLSASLQGLSVIRAYSASERFITQNMQYLDTNAAAIFAFEMTGRYKLVTPSQNLRVN
jgi:ABC-type multidrug transport system fused ATPase/permease subunit